MASSKFCRTLSVEFRCGDIVARAPQMGRVNADAQALAKLRQQVERRANLLEAVAQRVTSADIVFQQQHHFQRRLRQNASNGLGDTRNAHFYARATMASRVEDDVLCPQRCATLQRPAQQ